MHLCWRKLHTRGRSAEWAAAERVRARAVEPMREGVDLKVPGG